MGDRARRPPTWRAQVASVHPLLGDKRGGEPFDEEDPGLAGSSAAEAGIAIGDAGCTRPPASGSAGWTGRSPSPRPCYCRRRRRRRPPGGRRAGPPALRRGRRGRPAAGGRRQLEIAAVSAPEAPRSAWARSSRRAAASPPNCSPEAGPCGWTTRPPTPAWPTALAHTTAPSCSCRCAATNASSGASPVMTTPPGNARLAGRSAISPTAQAALRAEMVAEAQRDRARLTVLEDRDRHHHDLHDLVIQRAPRHAGDAVGGRPARGGRRRGGRRGRPGREAAARRLSHPGDPARRSSSRSGRRGTLGAAHPRPARDLAMAAVPLGLAPPRTLGRAGRQRGRRDHRQEPHGRACARRSPTPSGTPAPPDRGRRRRNRHPAGAAVRASG
ncbi:hypothetical protein SFUMM280S_01008 [Streptomyces fumanus]